MFMLTFRQWKEPNMNEKSNKSSVDVFYCEAAWIELKSISLLVKSCLSLVFSLVNAPTVDFETASQLSNTAFEG